MDRHKKGILKAILVLLCGLGGLVAFGVPFFVDHVVPILWPSREHITTSEPRGEFPITEIQGDGWRILDSGPGLTVPLPEMFWVDDRRVLFAARNGPPPKSQAELKASPNPFRVFVWDVEGTIQPLSDGPTQKKSLRVCLHDDELRIQTELISRGHGKWASARLLVGPVFGPKREITQEEWGWDWFTCLPKAQPPAGHKGGFFPLRQGNGYLTNSNHNEPIVLVRSEESPRVELPFTPDDASISCARYFEFKKAYFLYSCVAGGAALENWLTAGCLKYWWVWPDGRTESGCVSPPPPLRVNYGAYQVRPIKNGFLVISFDHESSTSPGIAGAYLISGGEVRKVMSGQVRMGDYHAVSPNGCRVAVSYSPNLSAARNIGPGPHKVRILDFCVGESESTLPN